MKPGDLVRYHPIPPAPHDGKVYQVEGFTFIPGLRRYAVNLKGLNGGPVDLRCLEPYKGEQDDEHLQPSS